MSPTLVHGCGSSSVRIQLDEAIDGQPKRLTATLVRELPHHPVIIGSAHQQPCGCGQSVSPTRTHAVPHGVSQRPTRPAYLTGTGSRSDRRRTTLIAAPHTPE